MEHGFAATSLRMITSRADVNLASVNYHFGSKDALVEAVMARRLVPLNSGRVTALNALLLRAGGRPLEVEQILEVYIGTMLKLCEDPSKGGAVFLCLLGRAFTEPTELVRQVLQKHYAEVASRFMAALAQALPHLPREELIWRMQFTFGAISYTMAGTDALELFTNCSLSDASDQTAVMRRLIAFIVPGLKAPASEPASPSSQEHP